MGLSSIQLDEPSSNSTSISLGSGGIGGSKTKLPIAFIVGDVPVAPPGLVFEDYQFKLTEESVSGDLDTIDKLKDVYDKWLDYVAPMDALPFLSGGKTGSKVYSVWTESEGGALLDNTGQLVIPRYWDKAWGELTKTNWTDHLDGRVTAFEAAKKRIEDQMAALKTSAFWEVSYEEDGDDPVFPLQKLHESMENFIKVPSTGLSDRGPWDKDERDEGSGMTILNPAKTGPLYELYFGHIPAKNEYVDQSNPVYPVGGGGKDKAGGGGAPGIMIRDAYDVVLGDGVPLTFSGPDAEGKQVFSIISGALAGFTYLKWTIDGAAASLGVVAPGKSEQQNKSPTVIPLATGTATVTVQNCTSTGSPGALTASFEVVVE
jgi:hypothetical protein